MVTNRAVATTPAAVPVRHTRVSRGGMWTRTSKQRTGSASVPLLRHTPHNTPNYVWWWAEVHTRPRSVASERSGGGVGGRQPRSGTPERQARVALHAPMALEPIEHGARVLEPERRSPAAAAERVRQHLHPVL